MSGIAGLGGSGGILNIAAQGLLAAATGGSSLAITTALRGVMLSIGDQVIQQIGKQLGLPPAVVDLAQAAFHAEAGDAGGAIHSIESASQQLGGAAGLNDHQTGQVQSEAYDAVKNLVDQVRKDMTEGKDENGGKATNGKGAKGQSFLVQLAVAMGKATDHKMDDMLKMAKDIDQANSGGDKSHITEMSGKMQALGQEVSMLSNALSTSLKSIGEASSTLARKN
jgi:hypothetical protein